MCGASASQLREVVGEEHRGVLDNRESQWYKKALATGVTEDDLTKMTEAWKEWGRRDESWSVLVSAKIVCRNR